MVDRSVLCRPLHLALSQAQKNIYNFCANKTHGISCFKGFFKICIIVELVKPEQSSKCLGRAVMAVAAIFGGIRTFHSLKVVL